MNGPIANLDYDHDHTGSAQIPMQLGNVSLGANTTLKMASGIPITYSAHIANLALYRNNQGNFATLDIGIGSVTADSITEYELNQQGATLSSNSGIDAIKPYLLEAYNADNILSGGVHSGDWAGQGIRSSAAVRDYAHGVVPMTHPVGDRRGGTDYVLTGVGWNPSGTNGVTLKYTWCGDTDLDGDVDART